MFVERVRSHWRDPLYRNGYYLMGNSAVGAALGFAFWILAARLVTPRDLGEGAAIVSAMTLAALLGKLGLDSGLIQYVPRTRASDKPALLARALLVSALLAAAFGIALSRVVPAASAWMLAAWSAATSAAWVLDGYFTAERSAGRSLVRNLAFHSLKVLVLGAAALTVGASIEGSWGVAALVSLGIALVLARPLLSKGNGLAPAPRRREFFTYAVYNYAHNVTEFIPGLLFPILVLNLAGAHANAVFYVAWACAFVLFLASRAISQSVFAELAHHADNATAAGLLLRKGLRQHAWTIAPAILVGIASGGVILRAFGPDYASDGYALLALLLVSAAPVSLVNLYVTFLKARGASWELTAFPATVLALSLALGIPLLQTEGILGIGVAWLAATLAASLVAAVRFRQFHLRSDSHDIDSPSHLRGHPHEG